MKAWELLSDESKWIKGRYAADESGVTVTIMDTHAVCWCAQGALYKCYQGQHSRDDVRLRLARRTGASIEGWNDAPERTYADVIAVLKELDI